MLIDAAVPAASKRPWTSVSPGPNDAAAQMSFFCVTFFISLVAFAELFYLVCGYNIHGFDAPIINNENARNDIDWVVPRTLDPFVWTYWYDRGVPVKKLGVTCERYGVSLPEDRAHTADADAFATGLLLVSMVLEGMIPDDVEYAFAEQLALRKRIDAEFEEYGRFVFPDRNTGVYRLGLGKHCGTPVDEADEGYLKWLLGRPDIKPKAKSILMKALGQVEQIGLF